MFTVYIQRCLSSTKRNVPLHNGIDIQMEIFGVNKWKNAPGECNIFQMHTNSQTGKVISPAPGKEVVNV